MGLLTPFQRSTKGQISPEDTGLRANVYRHDDEGIDNTALNEVNDRIAASMRKSMTYNQFVAYDQADEQGGFYSPEFDIRSTAGRIKALYQREPWIYITAFRIALRLASTPMRVHSSKDDRVVENHPLYNLLDSGSDVQSALEMRMFLYLDLCLGGNYFRVLDEGFKKNAGVAPVELVNFKYAKDYTRIEAIEVYSASQIGAKRAQFPMEQVIHTKFPNPNDIFYGMSPFLAAARPTLTHRYGDEYQMAFYLRGATPSGVIETSEDMTKNKFARMMRQFELSFTGRANWWRTLFLPKGSKWVQSQVTMQQMEMLETMKEKRREILAVMGVPPSIAGIIEDVNRATAEQQERVFYQNTIIPLAAFEAEGWNNSHLVKNIYKGQVYVKPDFSSVEAVVGSATTLGEKAKAMEPYFTIDEIRDEIWQREPLSNGSGDRLVAEIGGGASFGGPLMLSVQPTNLKAVIPAGFEVQALLFGKANYKDPSACQAWCDEHGYTCPKCEELSEDWLVQQKDPDYFRSESFRTIQMENSVKAIVGEPYETEEKKNAFIAIKASAANSQNRVEGQLSRSYRISLESIVDMVVETTANALTQGHDPRSALLAGLADRQKRYIDGALPSLEKAMDRGFSAANSQVKMSSSLRKGMTTKRFTSVSEQDRQAIDVIRERTREGNRRFLQQRAIASFQGMDQTQTNMVMQIVEDGLAEGLLFEQIAANVRAEFPEAYRNQSRTIVRTEILSAVSQGLSWNNDALNTVFTEVNKAWVHQGDTSNPDAREEHIAFDELGEVPSGHTWKASDGSELAYPRDPRASAGNVVNCRCSMISVIPESASSNAEAILDTEG